VFPRTPNTASLGRPRHNWDPERTTIASTLTRAPWIVSRVRVRATMPLRGAVGLAGTAERLCGMIYVVDRLPDVRRIRLETVIAAPATDCFDLSLSVQAHTDSMAGSGELAIAGVTSGAMKLGDTVTWRARHFGITFRMTSAITEYQRPIRFIDEQQHGPFRRWWHEHTFGPVPDGKTLMVDVVEFRSPLRWLAALVDRVVLARYLTHLLRQRNAWLKVTLEAPR